MWVLEHICHEEALLLTAPRVHARIQKTAHTNTENTHSRVNTALTSSSLPCRVLIARLKSICVAPPSGLVGDRLHRRVFCRCFRAACSLASLLSSWMAGGNG